MRGRAPLSATETVFAGKKSFWAAIILNLKFPRYLPSVKKTLSRYQTFLAIPGAVPGFQQCYGTKRIPADGCAGAGYWVRFSMRIGCLVNDKQRCRTRGDQDSGRSNLL